MQSSESSGGNLRLSTSCSAPSFRTYGRHATKVYDRGSRHCYAITSLHFSDFATTRQIGLLPVCRYNEYRFNISKNAEQTALDGRGDKACPTRYRPC